MDSYQSEIEFEAVLNTLVDGVVIINGAGIMRLFNQACVKIFGYDPEDVIGQNVKMLMPEPFHSAHDDYIRSYAKTGEKKIIGIGREVKGLRKDGRVFPMDLAVGETRLNGDPLYVGIIRDLTARNAQQKKYNQLQEDHFHLSRVAAMNEMGSAIAHELNQPLAASINYLETARILLGQEKDIDKVKFLDITSRAIEQTHRASEIIARMRGFIEKGDVEKKPTGLRSVIETASRLAFISFKRQNITLNIEVPEDLPLVLINDVQIQQVLVNLMKNACEAMSGCDKKQLDIIAEEESCGKMIVVRIKDTGHGLSEADVETLFVPFASKKKGGMGVGLSISQSIIAHHGGQIWACPNEPQGSVFHFTVPISEAL